jgi:hypothetical protein
MADTLDTFIFPDTEISYSDFFNQNIFVIKNNHGSLLDLIFKINNNNDDITVKFGENSMGVYMGKTLINDEKVLFTKISIIKDNVIIKTYEKPSTGGRKASVKKEICGKLRCIYKIPGSRKEHIKYKGRLIAVADYKKLMKKA